MASPTNDDPKTSIGGTNLQQLLKTMAPILLPERLVFARLSTLPPTILSLPVKMLFHEIEAWTVILPEFTAQAEGLEYNFRCRQITLNVHSSLEAVGFIAAVATKLTEVGVGVNPVAGFFHDHLFVPEGKERIAMEILEEMARGT